MDVEFTNAEDMPEKAILSVRVGDQRRQLQYKDRQTFKFEPNQARGKRIVVDIFEKVGTKSVFLADLEGDPTGAEFVNRVTVPRQDGDERPAVQVDMRVNLRDVDSASKRPASAKRRHQAAISTNNYLSDHGVQNVLTTMMQAVLLQEPANPAAFMIDYLTAHENAKASSSPQRPSSAPPANAAQRKTPLEKAPSARLKTWSEPPLEEEVTSLKMNIRDSLDNAKDSGNLLKMLMHVVHGEELQPLVPGREDGVVPPADAPPRL